MKAHRTHGYRGGTASAARRRKGLLRTETLARGRAALSAGHASANRAAAQTCAGRRPGADGLGLHTRRHRVGIERPGVARRVRRARINAIEQARQARRCGVLHGVHVEAFFKARVGFDVQPLDPTADLIEVMGAGRDHQQAVEARHGHHPHDAA